MKTKYKSLVLFLSLLMTLMMVVVPIEAKDTKGKFDEIKQINEDGSFVVGQVGDEEFIVVVPQEADTYGLLPEGRGIISTL